MSNAKHDYSISKLNCNTFIENNLYHNRDSLIVPTSSDLRYNTLIIYNLESELYV